jgi:hypothetical protein
MTKASMKRAFTVSIVSALGGCSGYYLAAILIYGWYPAFQYSFSTYLSELASKGAVISALFTWLLCIPIIVLASFITRRFIVRSLTNAAIVSHLFAASLLVVFAVHGNISSILFSSAGAEGMVAFLANALLGSGVYLMLSLVLFVALTRSAQHSRRSRSP